MRKNKELQNARSLFMSGLTQAEIAKKVGVTEKTVSKWATGQSWREIRAATHSGKANVSLAILERLDQETQKPDCNADTVAKLASSLDKIGGRPGLPIVMEVFMAFNDWLVEFNPTLAQQLIEPQETYFRTYNRNS